MSGDSHSQNELFEENFSTDVKVFCYLNISILSYIIVKE